MPVRVSMCAACTRPTIASGTFIYCVSLQTSLPAYTLCDFTKQVENKKGSEEFILFTMNL